MNKNATVVGFPYVPRYDATRVRRSSKASKLFKLTSKRKARALLVWLGLSNGDLIRNAAPRA
jgi:hypothetical protein